MALDTSFGKGRLSGKYGTWLESFQKNQLIIFFHLSTYHVSESRRNAGDSMTNKIDKVPAQRGLNPSEEVRCYQLQKIA